MECKSLDQLRKSSASLAHLLSSRRRLVEPLCQQLTGHFIEFILTYLEEENLFPAQLKAISTPQLSLIRLLDIAEWSF